MVDVHLLLRLLGVIAVLHLRGRSLTGQESLLHSGLFVRERGEVGLEGIHLIVILEDEVVDVLVVSLEDVLEDSPEEVVPVVSLFIDLGDGTLLHG